VREISDDEGNRLKRIVRRGSGSVVTWRRAQMVLWSAQGMSVAQIAGPAFTSEDRVRDVLHNFNADGFESLYPRYAGGRPPVFTLAQRREIKKIAKSKPAEHGLPFSRWSLAKLADFLVAEGVVEDISHEGLRELLRAENVSFQAVKTWKASADPDYAAKKARVDHLYAIADSEAAAGPGDPDVVVCMDRRVRPAEPAAAAGQAVGPPRRHRPGAGRGAAAAAAGHLPPHRRGAPPVRRLGAGHRQDVRAHQETQAARRVPLVLPLRARPAPGGCADRDRLRQLQPAPDHQERQARRAVGRGQQRRDRLHADEFLVDEPP
jgi:transposase